MIFAQVGLHTRLNGKVDNIQKILNDLPIVVYGVNAELEISREDNIVFLRPCKGKVSYGGLGSIRDSRYNVWFEDSHVCIQDAVGFADSSLTFRLYTSPR